MKRNHQKNIFRYFKKHLPKIVLAFMLTLVTKSSDFASTHFFSKLVDTISGSNFSIIWYFLIIMILLEVASLTARFLSEKILLNLRTKIVRKLHWNLAGCFAESSVESVKSKEPIKLTECMREGEGFVEGCYSIYKEAFNVLLGVISIIYTAIVSWPMALISVFFFILLLIFQYFKIKKMVESQHHLKTASEKNKQFLLEAVKGFSDMKGQSLIFGIKPLFSNLLEKEMKANYTSKEVILNNDLFSNILFLVYKVGFILLGILLVQNHLLTFGAFIAVFMYKGYIYGLVGSILNIIRYSSNVKVSEDRINSIFEFKSISKENFGEIELSEIELEKLKSISIKNLTLNYGNTSVLDNISLSIPASGGFIGIVGSSGSGKSTLAEVLAHQLTPTSGSITIDGVEMSELNEHSYRRVVCLAPQTPFLFSLSIRENLLLAKPNASENEIWKCLEACSADKFVREKGGLDVILDQSNLSGGERQRLALARLHLRGGKIILLDEATSALDGESQDRIVKTIRKASNMGHTMLVIAHRISSLKSADKIFLLDNGRVSDSGTYDELLQKSEKFNRLVSLE